MPLPKNNLLFGFEPKLTEEQRRYVNSIFDNQLTIVDAKSGTGKTTLAVACSKLLGKELVYIFSPVEESKMGFRPGNQETKERDYITPLLDALSEINENPMQVIFSEEMLQDPGKAKQMMENIKKGTVWVHPMSHVFARGINIKNKVVVIDEAQNFTKSELRKVLTRIHDDCKVIMIGHAGQIDLDRPEKSGFVEYLKHFEDQEFVGTCELTKNFRGQLAQHADNIKECRKEKGWRGYLLEKLSPLFSRLL